MSEVCSAYEYGCVLVHFICLMDLPRCEFSLAHLVHNPPPPILLTGHNLSVTTCLVKEKCLFLSTPLEPVLYFVVYISCLLVLMDHQFSPTPQPAKKKKRETVIFVACCSQDGQEVIPMLFTFNIKWQVFLFCIPAQQYYFLSPIFWDNYIVCFLVCVHI